MCMNFYVMITLLALSEFHVAVNPCLNSREHFTSLLPLLLLFNRILHFVWHYLCLRFWISFGMGTMLLTWRLRNCVSIMGRGIFFIFSKISRLTLGQIHPPIQWVPVILTGNSLPSITKAKNKWMYTFVPPYAFVACMGWGNFTFTVCF